ncbi:MAG: homoserine dehydrogenase [Armatimonadota bacterium]|nr:homoserine dehydrogenase [Armatimonadota bacterium]
MKDVINIGIIGFGTVGVGAVKLLLENADSIARKVGSRLVIKRVADLDIASPRPVAVDPSLLTTNAYDVLDDPEIDIVVEVIGGVKPADDYIKRALESGKHVVTANKELIAKEGSELLPLASRLKRDLMFEASVGGGIPIIRPLKTCLAGNEILEVKGIVNGTTNYILTQMKDEGISFSEALRQAQERGYAEADPSSDVDGHDAAYKIAILASIAFTSRADVAAVYREGIREISAEDLRYADQLGFAVKLLAIAKRLNEGMSVRVHPAFVPKSHPLAHVNGVYNAIFVRGNAVGEVMFFGRGAGSEAAGSAVVGDIIDIARNINTGATARVSCTCFDKLPMLGMENVSCRNYVRIIAEDKPRVLAAIAAEFANYEVSIQSVLQRMLPDSCAEIVWLTHEAPEPSMKAALDAIRRLPVVKHIGSRIRVED